MNVKGLQLSFGPEGRVKNIVGKIDAWLSVRRGDAPPGAGGEDGDLDIYGVGLSLAAFPFYWKVAGLGFLLDHGLEYRTESPHQGFGGFIGPGVQGILYFGKHVELTAGVEHDFGIGTHSRDVFRIGIGFGHRIWPPRVPKGVPVKEPSP